MRTLLFFHIIIVCLLIKLYVYDLLTLSPIIMQRNQKRCGCGHAAALWDTHIDMCRSCCGCSSVLPCGISSTWSPQRWAKVETARLYSSRRGKASGAGKRTRAAATSQGTPIVSPHDNTQVAGQGATAASVATRDIASAGGSLPLAKTLSRSATDSASLSRSATHSEQAIAADRSPVTGHRSPVTGQYRSPVTKGPVTGHRS